MKPGLAVLPLEVWADIFLSPWFTRQELAQILNGMVNRGFANKLDKLLHDCGQQTLHFLDISSKQPYALTQEANIPKYPAILAVSPNGNDWAFHLYGRPSTYEQCELPETEMPENIKTFKQLKIRHINNEVLAFLDKIKPLFTNVFLDIPTDFYAMENMRIVFTHLLPMLGSIRAISNIHGDGQTLEQFEQHFPGAWALAKELHLLNTSPTNIPTYLKWLSTPQDFDEHGPRLLWATDNSDQIFAIVDAVRKQFLAATTSATFVIFLGFRSLYEWHHRAEEFTFENAITKEGLTVRNADWGYVWKLCAIQLVPRPKCGHGSTNGHFLMMRETKRFGYGGIQPLGASPSKLITNRPMFRTMTMPPMVHQLRQKENEEVNEPDNECVDFFIYYGFKDKTI